MLVKKNHNRFAGKNLCVQSAPGLVGRELNNDVAENYIFKFSKNEFGCFFA